MDDIIQETGTGSPVLSTVSGMGLTLEELTQLSSSDLYTLFRNGQTPAVADLEGPYRGVQLATAYLDLPGLRHLNRWISDSVFFPWQGKTFRFLGDNEGVGNNQVLGGRQHVFKFKTYHAPSRLGDFSTFQLDYGQPENPPGVRLIRDELREIAPGIYLGLIFLQFGRKSVPLAFFGLSQALPESAEPPLSRQHRRQKITAAVSLGTGVAALLLWRYYRRPCSTAHGRPKNKKKQSA